MESHCHESEGEAWSLAVGVDAIIYLQHEADLDTESHGFSAGPGGGGEQRGFDFTSAFKTSAFTGFSLDSGKWPLDNS